MVLKYLMDENVALVYATQLRRRQPDLVIRAVGEPDNPSRSTLILTRLEGALTLSCFIFSRYVVQS